MILATAKKINNQGVITHYMLYNVSKQETKLLYVQSVSKLLQSGVNIINMRLSLTGVPEVGECNQGLPTLNIANMAIIQPSWLITHIDRVGVVSLVQYTGAVYTCIWSDLVYLINQVANAWIENGIIHGFFRSEFAYARPISYVSYS